MKLRDTSARNARACALLCAFALTGCASAPKHAPRTPAIPAPPTGVVATPTPLANRIDTFVAQPRFAHADWGIDVVSLDSGETLYAHDADKLFVPASNAKLYTAALALDTFGADTRITTSLYASVAPGSDGTLDGDLILYGRGDPSLGESEISPDWADRFAAALIARGIRRARVT